MNVTPSINFRPFRWCVKGLSRVRRPMFMAWPTVWLFQHPTRCRLPTVCRPGTDFGGLVGRGSRNGRHLPGDHVVLAVPFSAERTTPRQSAWRTQQGPGVPAVFMGVATNCHVRSLWNRYGRLSAKDGTSGAPKFAGKASSFNDWDLRTHPSFRLASHLSRVVGAADQTRTVVGWHFGTHGNLKG